MVFRSKRNRTQADRQLQALKTDFEALQRDMRLLLESLGTTAGERVATVTNGAAHQVEEWANDGVKNVRDGIRAQPLAAIAISMSAGAVISSLLRR